MDAEWRNEEQKREKEEAWKRTKAGVQAHLSLDP